MYRVQQIQKELATGKLMNFLITKFFRIGDKYKSVEAVIGDSY